MRLLWLLRTFLILQHHSMLLGVFCDFGLVSKANLSKWSTRFRVCFFFFKSWNLRVFLEIFYSKKFFKILVNKWCWISILQKWLLKMIILMVFNLLLKNWKGSKNEGINRTKFTYGWRVTVKIHISTTKIRFSIDRSNKFVSFMGNFHI